MEKSNNLSSEKMIVNERNDRIAP